LISRGNYFFYITLSRTRPSALLVLSENTEEILLQLKVIYDTQSRFEKKLPDNAVMKRLLW